MPIRMMKKLKLKLTPNWEMIRSVLLSSVLIIMLRYLGALQYLEWWAIDWFFKLRTVEPKDTRIVIVGVTEEDIAKLQASTIKDGTLAELLKKILEGQPSAIGVDILRDISQPPGTQELLDVFSKYNNVYGIGKQTGIKGHPDYDLVAPPPIPKKQITDISAIYDGDRVRRRGFLYPITAGENSVPSLATALAFHYLGQRKISTEPDKDKKVVFNGKYFTPFKLNQVTFMPFQKNTGPYLFSASDGGYQTLINWRNTGEVFDFDVVSVTEVLENRVNPSIFKDRLVLVGYLSPIKEDKVFTPLSRGSEATPLAKFGVEIQAQLASQIISATLDGRPLIKVWHEPSMSLWVVFWAGVGSCCIYVYRKKKWWQGGIYLGVGTIVLVVGNFIAFTSFGWLNPLIPPFFSMILAATIGVIYNSEKNRKTVEYLKKNLNKSTKPSLSNENRELLEVAEKMRNKLIPSLQRAMIFSKRIEKKLEDLEKIFANNIDSLNHQEIAEAFWAEIREIINLSTNLDQSFEDFRESLNTEMTSDIVVKLENYQINNDSENDL